MTIKFYKRKNKIPLTMLLVIILSVAYSCVKNDDIIYGIDDEPHAAIGFVQKETTVIEGDNPFKLEISASKLLFNDTTFEVVVISGEASGITITDINGNEGTSFTIEEGTEIINLTVGIEDDDVYTGTRILKFGLKILEGVGAFVPEESVGSSERRLNAQFKLTIEDDESVPPSIGFSALSAEIIENSTEAHKAIINLTTPAIRSGSFDIQLSGTAITDTDFVSEAINGILSVNFEAGTQVIEIDILPIDNNLIDGNKTVILNITNLSDGFFIGEVSEYVLTIVDDDLPQKETIIIAEADAWTRGRNGSGKSDDNGGDKTDLVVSDGDKDDDLREFYLKFDLGDIDLSLVTEAKIILTTTRESSWANAETNFGGVTTQSLYHVTDDSWAEMTITANNKPDSGSTPIATYTSEFLIGETTLSNLEHEFDVTAQIQVETDGKLSVKLSTVNTLSQRIFYTSREHSSNNPPKLVIVESLE